MTASNPQSTDNSAVAGWSSPGTANNPAAPSQQTGAGLSNLGGLSTAGSLYGIASGLQSGTTAGQLGAGLTAGSLANRYINGSSASTNVAGGALGAAGGALGIYNGIQQGGVLGYGGALQGGLRLGAGAATMEGDTALAGQLGSAAGAVAIPLAAYNFIQNGTASGKTGNDALVGATSGAEIGSVFGPVGAGVGLVIGGAVGALASAFGPGATDPEQGNWGAYLNAYEGGSAAATNAEKSAAGIQSFAPKIEAMAGTNPAIANFLGTQATKAYQNEGAANAAGAAGGAAAVAGATGTQDWQALSGLFDNRSSDLPFYQQYGRAGEGQFMTDMTSKINDAVKSGSISANATPQEIYQQVVNPWISSMNNSSSSSGKGWDTTGTGAGGADPNGMYQAPVQQLLMNLIGNYQQGQPMYNVGGQQANFGTYA